MTHHPVLRSAAAVTAALTGLTIGGLAFMGGAQAAGNGNGDTARHTISPAAAWASHVPGHALAAKSTVHAKVWLAPRGGQSQLEAFAKAVSDPGSASYGHYLSAAAYRSRFAPTKADVDAVTTWLTSAGLHVEGTGPDNHFLAVAGSPAAIDAAFTAGIKGFTVNGQSVTGATHAVSAPASVATHVLAVTGLSTLGHQVTPSTASTEPDAPGTNKGHRVQLGPPAGFVNAPPCSAYYGQKLATGLPKFDGQTLPYAVCGYTPSQLRGAYGLTSTGLTGMGQSIAITDAFTAPWLEKDANTYSSRHGEQPFRHGQFQVHSARGYDPQRVADCGGNGWYGEQTLDVEAEHAMAPDANVLYYGAASCYDDDLMAALAQTVADNQASIVSNSWGEPMWVLVNGVATPTLDDATIAAYESIFQQGSVQGIGFYFSSGDDGDELAAYGIKQTDYPNSDPWVTGVGGTSLAIDANNSRQFETGWGTHKWALNAAGTGWTDLGFLYGAGGGCSAWFSEPGYQKAVDTGCNGQRGVPDIAMDADPTTGMLVGETQMFGAKTVWGQGTKYGEFRIGGTSLASPLLAGLNASAQQGRSRIGFANPMIYGLYPTGVFFDVTPQGDPGNIRVDYNNGLNGSGGTTPSVRTFDEDSSLSTGPGWDQVTGVGTPTADYIKAVNAG
jgi:subtilase family serine protease